MNKFREFADAVNGLHESCKRIKETLGEFEDSKPKVWLTLDEAEQIEELLNGFVSLHNDNVLTVRNDTFDTVVRFKERIKRVGKENEVL